MSSLLIDLQRVISQFAGVDIPKLLQENQLVCYGHDEAPVWRRIYNITVQDDFNLYCEALANISGSHWEELPRETKKFFLEVRNIYRKQDAETKRPEFLGYFHQWEFVATRRQRNKEIIVTSSTHKFHEWLQGAIGTTMMAFNKKFWRKHCNRSWYDAPMARNHCMFNAFKLQRKMFPEYEVKLGNSFLCDIAMHSHINNEAEVSMNGTAEILDGHIWLQHPNGNVVDFFWRDDFPRWAPVNLVDVLPTLVKKRRSPVKIINTRLEHDGVCVKITPKGMVKLNLRYEEVSTQKARAWMHLILQEMAADVEK